MRIALDAMGTDHAPATEVAGAVEALTQLGSDIEIVLVGDQAAIEAELARHEDYPSSRLHVHHAPERILPSDSPAAAVRRKPESSIVQGVRLHKEGGADAFISAGSTGAVMASSLFVLRPLPGVERPTIATLFPTSGPPCLVVDAGANVDCKPRQLLQFAHLGRVYAKDILGVSEPRIGLLNIGEEAEKGNEVAVETYALLAADDNLAFVGNVEGRDIVQGACDVLVTDGFTGNVLLKFYESVAHFIVNLLQAEASVQECDLDLENVFRVLDYSEYGGVPLLGVNGVTIICHGGSPPKAIRNAVRVAARAVRSNMVKDMAAELSQIHAKGGPS
ncbi:MAG: phosphate acyltransferase PlsX [Gemmatimonadales bacterium]|nr:MAG: phosphate acyltransferase PlsX [Gemmatimonadales bacterium]